VLLIRAVLVYVHKIITVYHKTAKHRQTSTAALSSCIIFTSALALNHPRSRRLWPQGCSLRVFVQHVVQSFIYSSAERRDESVIDWPRHNTVHYSSSSSSSTSVTELRELGRQRAPLVARRGA